LVDLFECMMMHGLTNLKFTPKILHQAETIFT